MSLRVRILERARPLLEVEMPYPGKGGLLRWPSHFLRSWRWREQIMDKW